MASTNWIGGGDAETYNDPYAGGVKNSIHSLENSNLGAQAAAQSERAIGRRYQQRNDEIESNPSFGRNAAVSSKLHDMALNEVGGETASAYVKGAETDQDAKAKAGQLGIQAGQLGLEVNKENYQREQAQTFGNSFVGGLLKSAIGYAAGGAITTGMNYLDNQINPQDHGNRAGNAAGSDGGYEHVTGNNPVGPMTFYMQPKRHFSIGQQGRPDVSHLNNEPHGMDIDTWYEHPPGFSE